MTDLRALCARMAAELDHYRQLLSDDRREVHPLAVEARAALAQPEPEGVGPSDEELLELAAAEMYNAPNWPDCDYDARNPFPYEAPGVAWLNFARAVLSRWGRPAPAPAGEVGHG